MHPSPAFRQETEEQNIAFARERGFGTLCVSAPDGPLMAHVPFLLEETGREATLHLVRSNAIVRAAKEAIPAVIAVAGPDGYISPDWYGVDDQVPTWNYVAVHLRGSLEPMPQDTLRDVIDGISAHFENTLLPKTPWKSDKMTPDVMEKMMRAIVPYKLSIAEVQGTWKLNQNKPDEVRRRAAGHVEAFGQGSDSRTLAALMLGADKG